MNSRLSPVTERWLRAMLMVRDKRILELEAQLAAASRALTPTDPSSFSAEDERRRIATAQTLLAPALARRQAE